MASGLLATGTALAGITTFGGVGSGPGQFLNPHGLAVDPAGYVYVTDTDNHRVQKFDGAGKYVGQIGTEGLADGQFNRPMAVAVDLAGNLYVSEFGTYAPDANGAPLAVARLQKFDPAGNVAWVVPIRFEGIWAMATDPGGTLYAVDPNAPESVIRYDSADGSVVAQWTRRDVGMGPVDVATDPSGTLYLTMETGGVDIVSATGDTLGSLLRRYSWATRVAADSSGNVYVAMSGADGVLEKFGPQHEKLSTFGVGGYVSALAVGPSGILYVLRSDDVVRVDSSTPTARLTTPDLALTGQHVTFNASSSSVPLSTIVRYEWDLDGDGSFETDTGTEPTASHSYSDRGTVRVGVRVTAESGITDTAWDVLSLELAPRPGPVGVSINAGAQFTNDPIVSLSLRWPPFATSVLVANDGGFTDAAMFPVDAAIPWTLDSSGPERLPKTIYVRFLGGQSGPETYQDDIILDQTAPSIESLRAATRSIRDERAYRLRIRASDDLSGVANMQITTDPADPGELVPFDQKVETRSDRRRRLFVRVQDLAGNFSPWRRVRR